MFWTVEKMQEFAVDNNLTLDDAFKLVQLVYVISGVLIYKLFIDFLKSSPVEKFLCKWKKRFNKNNGKDRASKDV